MTERDVRVVRVPVQDTGLGREAGYANDEELVEAAKAMRSDMERYLTPEALARLDAAERELDKKFFGI
jgi:hypothetical protein